MKYVIIPLVLCVSCASHPRVAVRPALSEPVAPVDAGRYPEVIRAYYVGRYIDPSYPETMHGEHSVYRIESAAHWNLHPGSPNTVNTLSQPPDAAFAPPPTNDAVVAEINRQRDMTERVMQQAVRLSQSYDELQQVVGEMKNVARNHVLMGERLATTEQRVQNCEKQLQKLSTTPAPVTNEIPASVPESPAKP